MHHVDEGQEHAKVTKVACLHISASIGCMCGCIGCLIPTTESKLQACYELTEHAQGMALDAIK